MKSETTRTKTPLNRKLAVASTFAAVVLLVSSCTTGGANSSAPTTPAPLAAAAATAVTNLQTAFNGESNASAKYAAFATRADDEGYTQVASLFRAAARAESIHAANHARVIQSLGGTPAADVKQADVKSTSENLKAAIEGETYERDTMYPQFIAQARSANLPKAVQTLNFAQQAEAGHAKLYSDALANLGGTVSGTVTFYVCTVCGNTVSDLSFEKCPACFSPKESFVVVT